MTARPASPIEANLKQLRRGATYTARTRTGCVTGEYLGMEMLYGDFAILLRHADATDSIHVNAVESIQLAA